MTHDNHDNTLAPEAWANAVGQVAGAMLELMRDRARAHPGLGWLDMVMAAGIACRGVAAAAIAADDDLDLDKARTLMLKRFVDVLALPPELVKVVKADDGEDQQIVVVPTRKH